MNLVRNITRLIDQDDVTGLLTALKTGHALIYDHDTAAFGLAFVGVGARMTPNVLPENLVVPAGYTMAYPNMSVAPGMTVEAVGTLVDTGGMQ